MSDFDKLMGELQQLADGQAELAKALPADDGKDDKKIQAAAAEGGLEGDGDEDDAGGKGDGDADDKPMVKSMQVTLEDGTQAEAIDGTELVKSLQARIETGEDQLTKSMGAIMGLIKGQSDMIKSLSDQVKALRGEGRGRKTVVNVAEKPDSASPKPLVKSLTPEGMTADQFFAKALTAQREGRISGSDVAVAEACLNRGEAIPANIVHRVVQ